MMAVKKDSKMQEEIAEKLKAEGLESEGIEVATLSRGPDHLILIKGDIIGEYNHRSKRLTLYKNK
jgi:arginine repressor